MEKFQGTKKKQEELPEGKTLLHMTDISGGGKKDQARTFLFRENIEDSEAGENIENTDKEQARYYLFECYQRDCLEDLDNYIDTSVLEQERKKAPIISYKGKEAYDIRQSKISFLDFESVQVYQLKHLTAGLRGKIQKAIDQPEENPREDISSNLTGEKPKRNISARKIYLLVFLIASVPFMIKFGISGIGGLTGLARYTEYAEAGHYVYTFSNLIPALVYLIADIYALVQLVKKKKPDGVSELL